MSPGVDIAHKTASTKLRKIMPSTKDAAISKYGEKMHIFGGSQPHPGGDHRLSISCVVVERPDHHCGDDLVYKACI